MVHAVTILAISFSTTLVTRAIVTSTLYAADIDQDHFLGTPQARANHFEGEMGARWLLVQNFLEGEDEHTALSEASTHLIPSVPRYRRHPIVATSERYCPQPAPSSLSYQLLLCCRTEPVAAHSMRFLVGSLSSFACSRPNTAAYRCRTARIPFTLCSRPLAAG
jgi:hypothetical protein